MRCPECESNSRMLRTKNINAYLRTITHICRDKDCLMIFLTQQEFIRIIDAPADNDEAKHPR